MKKRLPALLIVFLAGCLSAAAQLVVREATTSYDVFRASQMLEVSAGKVSLDDLLRQPSKYRFVPTTTDRIQPYAHQFGYWLRCEVTNRTNDALFLQFVYAGTEKILVYEWADGRVLARHVLGSLQPESVYPFRKSSQVAPLRVGFGQTHTVFMYLEGVYISAPQINGLTSLALLKAQHHTDLFHGLYYGFILIIAMYSLLLYGSLREADTFRYAIWVLLMGLQLALFRGQLNEFLWSGNPSIERYATLLPGITGVAHILFTFAFLKLRQLAPRFYRLGVGILILYIVSILINVADVALNHPLGLQLDIVPIVALLEGLFSVSAGIWVYRRGFRPALYYVLGNVAFFASIFVFILYGKGLIPQNFLTYNSIHLGSGIEIMLFTVALTYKINLIRRQREQAEREQLRLLAENERLVSEQNTTLEEQVTRRTAELNQTLKNLKDTQAQLIHAEKMASLGELVAGIAHEIQNPLNFVNNFAEVSVELVDELKEEREKGDQRDKKVEADLLSDLTGNLQKITDHGQRADAIVKGMLQHSRSGSGEKQPTDLNALADEFLRLAYHGLRAKEKTFNAKLVTDFDAGLGPVEVIPPEMGRVLLNLLNNAFYAVQQRQKTAEADYQPTVEVCTARQAGQIVIKVKDNGTGMSEAIRQKIFQPFFTTKPTGQGTGLGLSLSYDIVTKGHGGELTATSTEGEGTEFTIRLPG